MLLAATPPGPGQNWLRWNSGLRDPEGWSTIGLHGDPTMPYGPLEASGGSIGTPGEPRVGVVDGIVTKRAARLRVVFRTGRPLELAPVDAGDRFPVNFYAGLYRQPEPDERRYGWPVVQVVAYDKAGRRVAQLQHGRS